MQDQEIKKLLKKYLDGNCSEKEIALLESWYLNFERQDLAGLTTRQLQEIQDSLPPHAVSTVKTIRMWPRFAAAVAILLFSGLGFFFLRRGPLNKTYVKEGNAVITPGSNIAMLTLADGRKILLNNAKVGLLANQGNLRLQKTGNGQLVYNLNGIPEANANQGFNTIATPNGGEYQVILPDGSKVWLNAASSLTYPVNFGGAERKVTLTGEAYFEIAKNRHAPFKVVSNRQTVEVLGTHFDINSYADEPSVKTTLLEGSVKVATEKNTNARLKPGQQSNYLVSTADLTIQTTDTTAAIAWKNGRFKFNNENIAVIMRKISRWYNVDVIYQGDLKKEDFAGGISRYDDVTKVLDMLQSTNTIHFKIEGRRIIVMK